MINLKKLLVTAAAVAALASTSAQAGGLFGDIADVFVPGSGRILDGIHDGIGKPLEVFVPGPVGQPSAPAVGNFCSTPGGRFGPGPMNPIGSPCYAYGWSGQVTR